MFLVCPTCGAGIARRWLFLALPWSRYECLRCGTVLGGTPLRLVLTSLAAGIVGYLLIAVIKGRVSPPVLIIPVLAALGLFTLRLPGQIREVKRRGVERR